MKKYLLFLILFNFSILSGDAQKIVKVEKPVKPAAENVRFSAEFTDKEWKFLTDSVQTEDWEKSAFLASQLINRMSVDNDKKQLAQLRYIYLYSLAGKIVAYSLAGKKIEEAAAREELSRAADDFVGQEFLMPPRRFLGECKQALNYICTVKDNENALRVTAANQEATAIHSFEVVLFDEKVDLREFTGKDAFLGGTFVKYEFNASSSNLWITRLSFVKGFIRVVVAK